MTSCWRLPVPLDRFQLDAIDALDGGRHVVVAAPTGSGKTVVAEYGIGSARRDGRRAFYTAPLKALSNQKFRDLGERYGPDEVGLLTGDNVINSEAPGFSALARPSFWANSQGERSRVGWSRRPRPIARAGSTSAAR